MGKHSVPKIKYTKIFINNEFVDSVEGTTFPTINPSTGEKICDIAEAKQADIDKAVDAARIAFKLNSPWRTMDASARTVLINKFADLVDENKDELAKLIMLDNGKPYHEAFGEVCGAVGVIRYNAGWCDKIHGKTIPADGPVFCMTRKEPVGVVGCIIPWNYPVVLTAIKISAALAAGCTVIIKPAEQTPLVSLFMAQLTKEAGFLPGVVNVVPGYGVPAGSALTHHPKVDKISFTGSTEVGREIIQVAGKTNLKRIGLELGGKSPLVVCDDADLDQAVQIAYDSLFTCQGQTCCAGTRTFVQDTIYDKFVKLATEKAKKRTVGDPFDGEALQGPQIDNEQFEKVLELIESGKKEGAVINCGGKRSGNRGYFIEPTVFSDVKDHMRIAKEEIFGPVQQIIKFSTMDEVIERSNDTYYGLASGIMTKNLDKALTYAQGVQAGSVWVNCFNAIRAQTPFGGFKQSGHGREMGEEGIEEFLETKTITIQIPQKNS